MHKHGILKRFLWLSCDLHFIIFYSKKGGILEQRAITYSAYPTFLGETWKRVPETPRNTRVPTKSSPGGGARDPLSAPRVQRVDSNEILKLTKGQGHKVKGQGQVGNCTKNCYGYKT